MALTIDSPAGRIKQSQKSRLVRSAPVLNVSKVALQYGELAKYYDMIYAWKDYAKESRTLSKLIRHYKRASGSNLLDVGCGTGKHI